MMLTIAGGIILGFLGLALIGRLARPRTMFEEMVRREVNRRD